MPKVEDMAFNASYVTLGRGEFDFLSRKLISLENSIADLRRDMARNGQGIAPLQDPQANGAANIDPAVEGRPRGYSHTDVHGVHVKNDAVSIQKKPFSCCGVLT